MIINVLGYFVDNALQFARSGKVSCVINAYKGVKLPC